MAVSLATLAKQQIAAEKRAAKELHLVARATFKATNATLYAIRSQDKVYHVTVLAGRVTSCVNSATGDTCQGWHYTGKCRHADFVVAFENEHGALEAKKQAQIAVAETVAPLIVGPEFAEDLPAHIDDELASQEPEQWSTFIGPDGSVLIHKHADDCDCKACEDARWQKIERACALGSNRGFSLLA